LPVVVLVGICLPVADPPKSSCRSRRPALFWVGISYRNRLTMNASLTWSRTRCFTSIVWARAASPHRALVNRAASRLGRSGFDPSRRNCGAPRRGHSGKGLAFGDRYHCPCPGVPLLTGLVTALGPACPSGRYAHALRVLFRGAMRCCARLIRACGSGWPSYN